MSKFTPKYFYEIDLEKSARSKHSSVLDHSKVTKKKKCCEYGSQEFKTRNLTNFGAWKSFITFGTSLNKKC